MSGAPGAPELRQYGWVRRCAPGFPVRGARVRVLRCPGQLHDALAAQCAGARARLALASLYVGAGRAERELLRVLARNPRPAARLLLDLQRATRDPAGPLLQGEQGPRCRVALYQAPQLRGLLGAALPPRYDELVGLQHMKIYICDDTVLLSGANCSNDYFTQRQDRYIEIEDKDLADFYAGLIDEVSSFSRQYTLDGIEPLPTINPLRSDKKAFIEHANKKITDYIQKWIVKQEKKIQESGSDDCDTWIFPLIQMGQLGITQDSTATREFIATAPSGSTLKLATGYFNLTHEYAHTIISECAVNVSLLMAHPNANGFLGAAGVAGGIPHAYSLIARKFWEQVTHYKQDHRVQLLEYERPGWTFHAKGLWYYPKGSKVPWMTIIGSANLGERSVRRDLEAQAAILTTSPQLQAELHQECTELHQYATECSQALIRRPIPLWVRAAVGLFRHYF